MRIISGKYKGQVLQGFDLNGTRPTMDRVKESLFGTIQRHVKDSVCLDLFAGSGSLGFEALSNGAEKCYFVDHSIEAIQTLQNNAKKIKIQEEVVFEKKDYEQALKMFSEKSIRFDLIFLDPPYNDYLIQNCLDLIEEYGLLNPDGIIICEYETETFDCSYTCIKEKKYGSKWVKIYQFDK